MQKAKHVIAAVLTAAPMTAHFASAQEPAATPSTVASPVSNAAKPAAVFLRESVPIVDSAGEARANAEAGKLTLGFREPVQATKITVESCSGEFNDGLEFFFGSGQRRSFGEGGRSKISASVPRADDGVRTLAIYFGHNQTPCLRSVKFSKGEGAPELTAQLPVFAPAGFSSPALAALFDSDSSSTFAIGPQSSNIVFQAPRSIDRLLVWTGDQSSEASFKKGRRATSLIFATDDGRSETVAVPDLPGPQLIQLSRPFKAQKITFSSAKGGPVAELRFGNAEEWIVPRAVELEKNVAEKRFSAFQKSALTDAVDRELATREERGNWVFRFRSDGSFFVYGITQEAKTASRFVAIGLYELIEAPGKKLRLRLSGQRQVAAGPWDGFNCGLACGERDLRSAIAVTDELEIEKWNGGGFVVRNRTSMRRRVLPFTDLHVKISTLSE